MFFRKYMRIVVVLILNIGKIKLKYFLFLFLEISTFIKTKDQRIQNKDHQLGEHHTASLSKLDQSKTQTRMYKGEYSSYYKEFDVGLKQEL
jgi:hypothetical protein